MFFRLKDKFPFPFFHVKSGQQNMLSTPFVYYLSRYSVVELIQISIYVFSIDDTEHECDYSYYGNYSHADIVMVKIQRADQQASGHAEDSPCHREGHKSFELHFRDAGRIADHVLWQSRYQIEDEDYHIGLF